MVFTDQPQSIDKSRAYIFQPALEHNCNELGHVRAGDLLKLIDVIGAFSTLQYTNNEHMIVTASLDRTNFVNAIHLWEFIYMESAITQVWKSSMEVKVTVYAVNFRRGPITKRLVATAHLIYVGLDEQRNKRQAPPLALSSIDEYQSAEAANIRRSKRFAEQQVAPWIAMETADNDCCLTDLREMTPKDANIQGNVFGGVILEIIARTGRKAAQQHCLGETVVGARMDRMSFLAPGFIGETIRSRAIVTKTWRTSLEVQVEIESINPNQPDHPRLIANCYLVFVRLNNLGMPADVPPWHPRTETQEARAESAHTRRHIREQERQQVDEEHQTAPALGQRLKLLWYGLGSRLSQCGRILMHGPQVISPLRHTIPFEEALKK